MELTLTRDAESGKVILAGWEGPKAPQLIVRERQQGRFLTISGWHPRSGLAPLVPVPDQPGAFLLDVDGNALAPGARVQIEIPASSHSQEAVWPPDLAALAEALAVAPAPAAPPVSITPRPVRPVRSRATPPMPEKKQHAGSKTAGLVAVLTLVAGGALGWQAASHWYAADLRALRTVQAERDTLQAEDAERRQQAKDDKAAFAQQVGELNAGWAELAAARKQLETEQKTVEDTRSQLEAEKAQLAAEEGRFALAHQGQTPAAVPAAGAGVLSAPMPDLAGAPGSAAWTPAVQQAALQCDLLAANPADRHRTPGVPGVPMPQLRANLPAAIAACQQASAAQPGQLNYTYQLARALQGTDPDQAAPLLSSLIQRGYPAAFDNMAWIIIARDEDFPRAAFLLRQGIARGDPDAMVSLADLIRTGRVEARRGESYRGLLEQASRAGHPNARAALNAAPRDFGDVLRHVFGR